MAKRVYRSVVRAESARETRAEILRAAEELFAGRGYTRTTVAQIAERAGVAVNTVYTSVGGKPALIGALARESTDDEAITESMAAVLAETDPRRILRLTAEGTGEVTRRRSAFLHVMVDNAASDPAVATAAEYAVGRYRQRLATIAGRLVTLGAVRCDAARTEQILWFYFGTASWSTARELGWDWDETATWLADQAASALLG
ncbi:TetR/AcrR family transcriptional regulator [Streptomyces sp. NPDC059631]|uniref:TetR/AcrR family transcriptional regulator n=1 Tax=unclassified Streptomyces TaxID=2593676 RepID=UPI0036934EBD